jgi:surfeit locus 1 family protein
MATALNAEPILLVARNIDPVSPTVPMPVGIEGIPNDHLGYAITWFMLAIGWALMTGLLIFRTLRQKDA